MIYKNTSTEIENVKELINERNSITSKYEYISNKIKEGIYPYQEKEESPCDSCNNNPKNGGSGICHCTLGLKEFNC